MKTKERPTRSQAARRHKSMEELTGMTNQELRAAALAALPPEKRRKAEEEKADCHRKLNEAILAMRAAAASMRIAEQATFEVLDFPSLLTDQEEIELEHVREALQATEWNTTHIADCLDSFVV